jgi:hypothetical protein
MDSLQKISYNHNNYSLLSTIAVVSLTSELPSKSSQFSLESSFNSLLSSLLPQVFFPTQSGLCPTPSPLVTTHYELDTAHAQPIFLDFTGSCSFLSPLFFSIPSQYSWSCTFSLRVVSSLCSLLNLTDNKGPNKTLDYI